MDKGEKRADGGYRTRRRLCNMKVFLIYQESHFGKRTWGGQSNPATTPSIYIYITQGEAIYRKRRRRRRRGNDSVCVGVGGRGILYNDVTKKKQFISISFNF